MKAKKKRKGLMEKGKAKLEAYLSNYVGNTLIPVAYEVAYQCIMEDQMPSKEEFEQMILDHMKPTTEVEE